MAGSINLTLDSAGSGLISGGGINLIRNDVYTIRIRVVENNAGSYTDASFTSPTFRLAFGSINSYPNRGFFKITTSTGTSSAISYNATTAEIASAVSAVAGNVTVATYGPSGYAWTFTAATANTALNLTGNTFSLFPSTTVQIDTIVPHSSGVTAVKSVELVRLAAVSASAISTTPTVGVVTMSKIQTGSATGNTIYNLSINPDAVGGSYCVLYGTNSTTAVSLGASSSVLQSALSSVTGLGSDVNVTALPGNRGHLITFVGSLGLTNVTTALSLDLGGVKFATWYETTLTMAGVDLNDIFANTQHSSITCLFEIEMTEASQKKTLMQATATIRKDLQP